VQVLLARAVSDMNIEGCVFDTLQLVAMHLGSSFSVTVVERGSPGSGSTGLSAATVWNPGFDESMPVLFKVRNGSAKIYRQLEVDGFKCDLKISGSLTLALDASQNTFIQQQYESLKRVGANVELLKSQMDLIKLDPCFEGTIARSALYFPESLHVNTMLATQSMLDSSKAQLIENTSVVGIKRSADGLYSLTLSNGIQMVCKHLVLANGIWLPELALKLNLLVPITPVRGQIWMTETVPEWFMNHIVFLVAAEYEFARYSSRCDIQGIPEKCTHNLNLEKIVSHAYGRKTVDGNILFGGDRVPLSSPWDHQKLYAADQELVEENRSYVYSFLPSLQAYEVEGAWAGPSKSVTNSNKLTLNIVPFSRDGKPIAGSLEKLGYANLWIIGGYVLFLLVL